VIARSFSRRYSSTAALNPVLGAPALPQMNLTLTPELMELLAAAGAGYEPTKRSENRRG
jgi:hypothetical protein